MNPTEHVDVEAGGDHALVYTPSEVAAKLKVHRSTVHAMISRGELPSIKFAEGSRRGARRIPKWAVDQLVGLEPETAA